MSENNTVDPTALGLFMVAAISLPLAAVMLKLNGAVLDPAVFRVAGIVAGIAGIIAYKGGNAFGFTVFMIVAAGLYLSGTGLADWGDILFGILFALAGIWAIFIKTPKLLIAILFVSAVIFILLGLNTGIVDNADFNTIIGVLAIINFLLSAYLGFALATQKAPVI